LTFGLVGLALASAGTLVACDPPGTTFTVNTTVDAVDAHPGDGICEVTPGAGDCSLRAAVMEANADPGADTVALGDGSVYRLTLLGADEDQSKTGDIDITDTLTMTGRSIIDGGNNDRVLDAFAPFTLDGATLTNGRAKASGANFSLGGDLRAQAATTLTGVTIENGTSMGGGGVYSTATLTVGFSTFATNHLTLLGSTASAIQVAANVSVKISQSTFSGNSAPSVIGGTQSVYQVAGTTFADNAGSAFGVSTSAIVRGTAVQSPSSVPVCNSGAIVVSGGYNVVADATCGLANTGDVQGTQPIVAALTDNGGPTFTDLPFKNSPLVNKIPVGTPGLCDSTTPIDQRAHPRPLNGTCDIGSVEGASDKVGVVVG
jgi:CSLREA domain-containing protein